MQQRGVGGFGGLVTRYRAALSCRFTSELALRYNVIKSGGATSKIEGRMQRNGERSLLGQHGVIFNGRFGCIRLEKIERRA